MTDMRRPAFSTLLLVSVALTLALATACGTAASPLGSPAASSPTPSPAASVRAGSAAPSPGTSAGAPAMQVGLTRLTVLDGTEARFRVKEQLVGVNLPGEAVGATRAVDGTIALGPGNVVDSDQSKLRVDLTTLKSDDGRRDRYLQDNTLRTGSYPEAIFVPREVKGLPSPLPDSGELSFQLVGDMTIRGQTRSVAWDVTSTVSRTEVTGQASTSFAFAEFGLTIPRVPLVLSVVDNIRLEVDFRASRES